MEFKIDNQLKQEYLSNKLPSTAKSVAFVLRINASIVIRQALVKLRRANRRTINELKSMYSNSCQICEPYFSQTHGVEVVEAHHIEYFSKSLNHHPTNIVIVCPNHHIKETPHLTVN